MVTEDIIIVSAIIGFILWRISKNWRSRNVLPEYADYVALGRDKTVEILEKFRDIVEDPCVDLDVFATDAMGTVFTNIGIIYNEADNFLPYNEIATIKIELKKKKICLITYTNTDGETGTITFGNLKGNNAPYLIKNIREQGYPLPDYKGIRTYDIPDFDDDNTEDVQQEIPVQEASKSSPSSASKKPSSEGVGRTRAEAEAEGLKFISKEEYKQMVMAASGPANFDTLNAIGRITAASYFTGTQIEGMPYPAYDNALFWFEREIEIREELGIPDYQNPGTFLFAGSVLMEKGEHQKAVEYFNRIAWVDNAAAHGACAKLAEVYYMGWLSGRPDYDMAEKCALRAVELNETVAASPSKKFAGTAYRVLVEIYEKVEGKKNLKLAELYNNKYNNLPN